MAIGPIGDDIPSIFPIVIGVVLFLGVVMYANQQVDARNNYLEIRKAGLSLSYLVLSRGLITDEQFNDRCTEYVDYAARQNIKAFISLHKSCEYVDLNAPILVSSSSNLICPQTLPTVNGAPLSTTNLPADFQILVFPVAVDCDSSGLKRGLGTVNLVVWRK
ncbi:hypothetical protein AUJ14_04450 [Candidatus Micrarchaeota archaeon CG1_02_55_22]|nr:MAG: hypothetical protein AUJ14_04450 [Candidatus Micrarchaeota archaeon CG1_02_55_22]